MIKENVIENILYRFNPYFPENLPTYEITPADPQDVNVKLGEADDVCSVTTSNKIRLTLSCIYILQETAASTCPLHCRYS